MNGTRTLVISIALLAMLVTSGWAATLEVSQPVQVTSDSYYERGQAIVYDGTDYWLFYGRSASCTVPYSSGDPDIHDYQVYLSKASTVAGLADATPIAISGAADSYLGETGAVAYGADVWVFATIDADGVYTPTSDCDLYGWWSADGTSWSQVGPIISGIGDGQAHHDEVVFDGKLWVLDGSGSFTTMYSTTPKTGGWSTPVTVGSATGGLGHFFVDGTSLYLALGSGGSYYIYVWDGVSSWTLVDSKTISGYYDPTLLKVGSDYVFYCAPYTGGRQWIVGWTATALDGSFFDGPEMDVIEGRYGSNVWVDMWPIGFTAGGTSYLFYTSERDTPSAEGPGNIWYTEVDWAVSNDHYTYVQEAINAASGGDVIEVGVGTYAERLSITSDIDLRGAQYGVDPTPSGARTTPADESIITEVGLSTPNPDVLIEIGAGATNASVDGFTLNGDPLTPVADTSTLRCWANGLTIGNNIITGKYCVLYKGGDGLMVDSNRMTANKEGVTCQPGASTNVTVSDNTFELGGSPAGDESAMYMTSTTGLTVTGNTANTFVNAKGIAGSSVTNVDVSGNDFSGNKDAVSFWGSTTFVDIYDNDLSGSSRFGVSIKGQDVNIYDNDLSGNGDSGANVDRHVIDTERVSITGNDLSGNASFGVRVNTALVTEDIDASANYWGSTVAATVRASANAGDGVDYTPWLAGGTAQDPGYAGDYATLYVDDDSAQTGALTRIQEGIDLSVGSTVNVLDGTYGADVATGKGAYIIKDGLSLIGQSQAGTIIDGSIGGVGGSGAYWPRGIHVEADSVTVRNFTVKDFTGDLMLTGGYGVLNRDYTHDEIGEGYVFYDGCTVEDVTVSGCYSSIYALCFTHLTVADCTVTNSLADGMFIARGSDYANIHDNVVTNSGDHGIWVGYSWTATTPSDNAIISGNVVDGAREGGISFVASDGALIEGNEITNVAAEGWSVGALSLKDGPSNVTARYNQIHGNDGSWGGYSGTGNGVGIDGTPANISINLNSIYGNVGYGCYNYSTVAVDATNNWWGDASGPNVSKGSGDRVSDYVLYDPWIGKTGSENIVCDLDPEYLTATFPTKTVDVEYLGGGGGLMYGYSLVFTWDGAIASTAPGSVTQGTLLSDAGSTFFFPRTTGVNEITVDCMLLGTEPGVTGPGKMFSIAFTGLAVGTSAIDITVDRVRDKDNVTLSGFFEDDGELIVDVSNPTVADVLITNDTLAHTNDYIKNTDQATVTANVSDDDPGFGLANIAADLTGLGGGAAVNPDAYADPVATWTLASVTCVPSDGVVTVTVTATDAMANTANANDTIIADNTAPTAVTGFDASPANEECDLSWTNGTDDNFVGVVVQRDAVGGEYPQYPWFVANWPNVDAGYPGSELLGTNVYDGVGTSVTDAVVARNIYYYQAFCYDEARNYGAAVSTARDLATNYWLGDVSDGWGTWGYDGLVDANDILKLSDSYGTANPVTVPGDAECDVGPTVHPDWNRLGLPEPDDSVEFEDAMIFAMNYGVVTARVVPFLPEEYNPVQLALTLNERGVAGDEVEVAMTLEGNSGDVKGMSAEVAYDPSELEFVSARLSADMSSPLADVFFWSGSQDGRVMVDALVLGTDVTIGGCGDVAVLTFRMVGEGYSLGIESARIRNADNVELDAKLGDLESGGDLPMAFRLVGNTPNPFNPVTKIAYHVPHESDVTIRIYDVSGRVVATLVDGVSEPGRHVAVWNGKNDRGEAVGSGVYFCTMEAPEFQDSRKMTLLK
jgi:hypothetical protein